MRAMEPLIDTGFVFVSVRANKRHHHRQVVGEGEGKKRGGASPGMGGTWQRNCCRSRSSRSQMGTCAFCLAAPAAAIKGGLSPYRRTFCGESTHSRAVDVPHSSHSSWDTATSPVRSGKGEREREERGEDRGPGAGVVRRESTIPHRVRRRANLTRRRARARVRPCARHRAESR